MAIDPQLDSWCLSVGLDLDEMTELYRTRGTGAVLARIGEAQFEQPRVTEAGGDPAGGEVAEHPLGVGSRRWRNANGPSSPLTIRLDHDEVAELRRRADQRGIGVSVLARAYIRKGLGAPPVTVID